MKTPLNLLQNTQKYRKTEKGLITNLYGKIRERSKRNDRHNDEFTLGQFKTWIAQTNIDRLYQQWKKCGYKTDRRPSIDRINPLRGYTFDNMQVVTAKENRKKGDEEKIILWGKPISQISMSGNIVAKYPNIKTASEITGINKNNISSVLNGKRGCAGGYKWKHTNYIYENPELLKEE